MIRHRFGGSRNLGLCVGVGGVMAISAAVSQAALVTQNLNVTLTATPDGPNNTYNLDLNGDGVTDFTFVTIIGDPTDPGFASFAQVEVPFGTTNGEVVDAATADGFPTVSKLAAANVVGSSSIFSNVNDDGNLYNIDEFDPATGNFDNSSGYVGLRFASGGNTYYGFAYVSLNDLFAAQDPLALTIGEVGYETTPGVAVTLPAVAVPEPASLAGASIVVLVLSRRRRTSAV